MSKTRIVSKQLTFFILIYIFFFLLFQIGRHFIVSYKVFTYFINKKKTLRKLCEVPDTDLFFNWALLRAKASSMYYIFQMSNSRI